MLLYNSVPLTSGSALQQHGCQPCRATTTARHRTQQYKLLSRLCSGLARTYRRRQGIFHRIAKQTLEW
jgi:ribosomal protein L17